jgi:hypothetical protein
MLAGAGLSWLLVASLDAVAMASVRWVSFLGEYPEESLEQRAQRGIFVGVAAGATVLTIPFVFEAIDAGQTQIAISLGLVVVAGLPQGVR